MVLYPRMWPRREPYSATPYSPAELIGDDRVAGFVIRSCFGCMQTITCGAPALTCFWVAQSKHSPLVDRCRAGRPIRLWREAKSNSADLESSANVRKRLRTPDLWRRLVAISRTW